MNHQSKKNNKMKKSVLFTILTVISWTYIQAQTCDPDYLSTEGLQHFMKSQVYIENLEQGTHEKVVEELEFLVKTDSLWCYEVYLQLGRACEEIYAKKKTTRKIDYLNKAIFYYKKYNILKPNNTMVVGKIAELNAQLELSKNTVNNEVNIEMVYVEGMLNADTTDCIHSFYIGKYEVTQAQWEAVMGSNPSYFKGPNLPVENVSYYDVLSFINELNRLTGNNYRLPTEKEWEYAMHGGKKQEPYTYSGSYSAEKVGWVKENSNGRTHPVGEKYPNSIGVYDMTGNVSELLAEKNTGYGYDNGRRKEYYYYTAAGHNWFGSSGSSSWMGINKSSETGFRLVIPVMNYSPNEQSWEDLISEKEQRRILQIEKNIQQYEQEQRAKINRTFRILPTIGYDYMNSNLLFGVTSSYGNIHAMALYQTDTNYHFSLGGKIVLLSFNGSHKSYARSYGIYAALAYSTKEKFGLNIGITSSWSESLYHSFVSFSVGTLLYKGGIIIPLIGIGLAIP